MTIEAAGGVLWRQGVSGDPEVALVHRPRYDDWSLPKGKLDAREHPLAGALREIEEETGFSAVPGRPLGEVRYAVSGEPKRVRYWACRAVTGRFRPGREVDELTWATPADADALLPADRDRPVLRRFAADPRPTRALVVVRHASAGDRDTWSGDDRDRPLDARGREQAEALAALLRAYGVRVAVSAEVRRCRDTLAPFADASAVTLRTEAALTAGTCGQAQPDAGARVLLGLAGGPAAVVCTQRELAAEVVAAACTLLGRPTTPEEVGDPEKGGLVVLHVGEGRDPALVDWEWLPPPA